MAGRPKIAILGGGMAGCAAAWRLSEGDWRARFESITVYQRGWRLGGKGASGRGVNGRIEEHGLHVWLGHYDNAFRLMRDCYAELDRPATDPASPLQTWRDAFVPSSDIGIFDQHDGEWRPWIGRFTRNDRLPGDPDAALARGDQGEVLRRVARLMRDLVESFEPRADEPRLTTSPDAGRVARISRTAASVIAAGAMVESLALASGPLGEQAGAEAIVALDLALEQMREVLTAASTEVWGARQGWQVIGLIAAVTRGAIADGVLLDPGAARRINDEEFLSWIRRHGASEAMVSSTYVRGLYDLVFGHAPAQPGQRGFGAGLGAVLSIKTMLAYQGAFFWKMTAGMGDVVFAPMYEVLRRRGVDFEFFHRVDALRLDDGGNVIDAIDLGRQVALVDGAARYEPLRRVKRLPCFPSQPLPQQLACDPSVVDAELESAWSTWPDAQHRVLRRGEDFDHVVFAMPPPVAREVARDLIAARPEWKEMVDNIATVATQALQVWLRSPEHELGWDAPGTTMTGYVDGFDTWASMPQLIDAEDWGDDGPGAIGYFCDTLPGAWPPEDDWAEYARSQSAQVRATAERFCRDDLPVALPGFTMDQLIGGLDAQYWRANVDPSDRYVQSLPGTDQYRLRPDESGFDNLVLAGDWTDCGINAGCIEAAVVSGLEAANALLGRHRFHRVMSEWLV